MTHNQTFGLKRRPIYWERCCAERRSHAWPRLLGPQVGRAAPPSPVLKESKGWVRAHPAHTSIPYKCCSSPIAGVPEVPRKMQRPRRFRYGHWQERKKIFSFKHTCSFLVGQHYFNFGKFFSDKFQRIKIQIYLYKWPALYRCCERGKGFIFLKKKSVINMAKNTHKNHICFQGCLAGEMSSIYLL